MRKKTALGSIVERYRSWRNPSLDASPYQDLAQRYYEGARALFAPVPAAGLRGVTPLGLAEQAEQLLSVSSSLIEAMAAQLQHPDAAVRAEASSRLLAKALADLEISRHLQVAAAHEANRGRPARGAEDLGAFDPRPLGPLPAALQESLCVLVGQPVLALQPRVSRRGVITVVDLPGARQKLTEMIAGTLTAIRDGAAKEGQAALGGLLSLGLSEVIQAAGLVGMDVAQALGQAEEVTRLYNLVRSFAANAYSSLLTLVGPALAQMAANQIVAWAKDVVQGAQFTQLLEGLYETEQTRTYLGNLVAGSDAGLEKLSAAIEGVDSLGTRYQQQMSLVEKMLSGLQLLTLAAVAAMPQMKLFLAATSVVIMAYVVLCGADYVDAQQLKFLNRVPGVRQIVETNLGVAKPAGSVTPASS